MAAKTDDGKETRKQLHLHIRPDIELGKFRLTNLVMLNKINV